MSHPTVWEYLTVPTSDNIDLNALGAEGWELAGVDGTNLYFKLPVTSFRERVTLDQKRHYFDLLGVPLDEEEGSEA